MAVKQTVIILIPYKSTNYKLPGRHMLDLKLSVRWIDNAVYLDLRCQ